MNRMHQLTDLIPAGLDRRSDHARNRSIHRLYRSANSPNLEPYQSASVRAPRPLAQRPPPAVSTRHRSYYGVEERTSPPEPMSTITTTTTVTWRGEVNASFEVPGLINIPSDGVAHNITVATLKPQAMLKWVCVPSENTRVHLKVSATVESIGSRLSDRLRRRRSRTPRTIRSAQAPPTSMSTAHSPQSPPSPLQGHKKCSPARLGSTRPSESPTTPSSRNIHCGVSSARLR